MKNYKAIILLFIANSISGCAQGISMISIPWYFTQQGQMGLFGQVYVVVNIVSLFWVPYCGTLIDRFNRKHIFLAITTISGILLCSVALLGYHWHGLPWYFVAAVFAMTFFNYNIHYPTLYAFVQEITEQKYYGKITSALEIQGQITAMMAGAIGAMLLEGTQDGYAKIFGFDFKTPFNIEAWTIYEIFMMDAATYVASFIIISFIMYQPLVTRKKETDTSVTGQLRIGWNYLMENKNVFLFGVASHAIFVAVLIEGFYSSALYVNEHLEEKGDVYASSQMYYALGAIFAGFAIRKLFTKIKLPISVIIMTFITSIIFMVLAVTKSSMIFFVVLLILGITNAGTRIQRVNYLFAKVPNQVYGRTGSIFFLSNILFRIVLLIIFSLPFFQIGNNVIYTFAIMSAFIFLAGVVLSKNYKSF